VQSSPMLQELAAALAAAQREMNNPRLDSVNPHFKSRFASLAGVRDCVREPLARHGLSYVQLLGSSADMVTCETVLMHKSGQWISGTFGVAPTKRDPQGMGSAATYARRYSLMAIVGVVGDDDDDGNASSAPASRPAQADDAESRLILDSLREAALDGIEALQARFRAIPKGAALSAVWAAHGDSLKATAAKVPA
jgi:hypothetical protein